MSSVSPRLMSIALAAILSIAGSIAVPMPARAADTPEPRAVYRTGPGDTIDIAVRGVPDLTRRVAIELDGTISFPGLGTITASGLTLHELRVLVKSSIGGRGVSLRNLDGGGAIPPEFDDIHVGIASYRPIYVKGDVVKSGEYPYRGPMAIREAVALAGGYAILRGDRGELALRSLDFKGEQEALWLEFAKERARVWRISIELGARGENRDAVIAAIPPSAPVSRDNVSSIVDLAAQQLDSRRANDRREHAAVDAIIAQLDDEIKVTSTQVAAEEKAYEADLAELRNLTTLKEKGVVNPQRFADARRAVLFSSTRILQANAKLGEVKRLMSERTLQKYKLTADRMIALYLELETATVRLGEIQAKLRSVVEKIHFAAGNSTIATGQQETAPSFIVHRRGAGGITRSIESESFELLPGDVVDIALLAPDAPRISPPRSSHPPS